MPLSETTGLSEDEFEEVSNEIEKAKLQLRGTHVHFEKERGSTAMHAQLQMPFVPPYGNKAEMSLKQASECIGEDLDVAILSLKKKLDPPVDPAVAAENEASQIDIAVSDGRDSLAQDTCLPDPGIEGQVLEAESRNRNTHARFREAIEAKCEDSNDILRRLEDHRKRREGAKEGPLHFFSKRDLTAGMG